MSAATPLGFGPALAACPRRRVLRAPERLSCDPAARGCWLLAPARAARVDGPLWDTDEALRDREEGRRAVLAEIGRCAAAWGAVSALPRPRYTARARVEALPLRQRSVAGDLAAALAELPDRKSKAVRALKGTT